MNTEDTFQPRNSHVTTEFILLTCIVCVYVFFLSFPGSGKVWADTWEPAQQYTEPKTSPGPRVGTTAVQQE